jgi:hypothetical protein
MGGTIFFVSGGTIFFERTYAAGPYHREIDYASDVPPPLLNETDRQWVKQRLAGLA